MEYEYANRIITCKNLKTNAEITFTERGFTPFLLAKAAGIYEYNNNVGSLDNVMIDGATYQGSVMKASNIVLTVIDVDNYEHNRDLINAVFESGVLGSLTVTETDNERMIEYYTESVSSTAKVGSRTTVISLICTDPHFYDPYDNVLRIANIMDTFQFPHEFVEEGETFSYINVNQTAEIINNNAEENTGITMIITALGTIVDPKITKVESQEKIEIGYTGKTFTMSRGDVVVITTHSGNKNILYTHEGETTDINHYLSENSDFFQITRGVNTIGYDATTGSEYVQIDIIYKTRYARA